MAPPVAEGAPARHEAEGRPRPKFEEFARYSAPLDRYAGFRREDRSVLRRQSVPDSAMPRRYPGA
jgi:hypothetical protein